MSSCSGQSGFFIRITYLLLTLFFHIAIFLVALIGLANYWLPMVGDYKDILEKELTSFVGNQITIGKIRVDRESASPRWIFENLQLTETNGFAPIHIQSLELSLDWEESLRTLRLQPADIRLTGVEFTLRQKAEQLPEVAGLTFPLPGQKNTTLNVERKTPINVTIAGGAVHWLDTVNKRNLSLNDLQFTGEFLPKQITLQAKADFPSDIGKSLGVDAVLTQEKTIAGKDEWAGNLHAQTRIFNLAALPSALLQRYGIAAGAVTADVKIKSQAGKPLHVSGEGEIRDFTLSGTKKLPAMNHINADFNADNDHGKVVIHVKNSVFNFPQWFEKPIPLNTVGAELQWQVQNDGWHWQLAHVQAANPDIHLQGSGTFDAPLKKAPNINLNLQFATQRTVDNVRNYIPAIVLDNTEEWLKTAIVSGYVPKGEFILRGNPSDFPFKTKPGIFDIRFDIENGVLAYFPEWPEARNVYGEIRFHNEGMAAKVKSARIMDLTATGGTVAIPDMLGETHLLLDLNTQGALKGHMDYLQNTPIGTGLRDFMQVADFKGNADLNLKLDVPLDAPVFKRKGVNVDGAINLHNNTFSIPEYAQTFTKLNGTVKFDEIGVDANNVTAEYHQQPLNLAATTDKVNNQIVLQLQQHNAPAAFLPDHLASLADYFPGKSDIDTQLELPTFNFSANKASATLKIHATSQLQGVAIKLPAPFGKNTETPRTAQVDIAIPFESTQAWLANIQMEDMLTVNARLPNKGKGKTAVSVNLGATQTALPTEGISIQGSIPQLDLFALQGLGATHTASKTAANATPSAFQTHVTIDDLRLGKQSLGQATVSANTNSVLQAQIQADKAHASLFLPLNAPHKGRVNVDLKDIDLDQLGSNLPQTDQKSPLLPTDFPSLRLTCSDCRKGDFPLQNLTLDMEKSQRDLRIRRLEMRNPQLHFIAEQGRWFTDETGASRTEITAQAHIPQPAQLLKTDGSDAGFDGGELHTDATLQWAGAPFEFALNKLRGDLHVTLGKGSLLEVEPGVGRLLGLLDVQRLSSRLQMDFRDMTGKGVAFDRISGHFHIEDGVLSTQDTIVSAPAMVAGIHGSSDLIHKTHAQNVVVIPNFRATLPVVGVAVGGVGGGIAMLLFNSFTQQDAAEKLQTSGGFRYRVTGAWEKPDITELKEAIPQPKVDVFSH